MVRSGAVITFAGCMYNYVYLVHNVLGGAANGILYEHGVEVTHGDSDQHHGLAGGRTKKKKKTDKGEEREGWHEANSPSLARLEINEGHLCHWLGWC